MKTRKAVPLQKKHICVCFMRKIIIFILALSCIISPLFILSAFADDGLKAGDVVYFGTYEQDNNQSNGAERLKWRVLDVNDGKALLITSHIIDIGQFNDKSGNITWEDSNLRSWLNTVFYNTAFTVDEMEKIAETNVVAHTNPKYDTDCGRNTTDFVFLLSYNEAKEYFDNSASGAEYYKAVDEVVHPDLMAFYTPYALAKGGYLKDKYNTGTWWLRTMGISGNDVCNVSWAGYVSSYGHYSTMSTYGIRPAIWVYIDALEKTTPDPRQSYAAVDNPGDNSETESQPADSSDESMPADSSEEISDESLPDISYEESDESFEESEIYIDISDIEDSSEEEYNVSLPEESNPLEDSTKVDNKFKILGIVLLVLTGIVAVKAVYGYATKRKRY